jgi:BMFP domain-containing protein YqiC
MNTHPDRYAQRSTGSFVALQRSLSRRQFLRGAGIVLSLPLLDSMLPAFARAGSTKEAATKPRRMFAICNNLGLLPEQFFPKVTGRGYALSPYLDVLKAHRDDFTVFSGVSHPDVDGGHPADICFLTAAPHPGSGGFRNTISLDQYIAERIGHQTRFPSLTLGVNVQQGIRSLSWTASGVLIPCEEKASDVFKRLFVQGTAAEVDAQIRRLAQGQSVLDAVGAQAKDLQRSVGARDRDRLDQYFTSVRELERRMEMSKEWERKPKPRSPRPCPWIPRARANTWTR